jgi:hypothetical protein
VLNEKHRGTLTHARAEIANDRRSHLSRPPPFGNHLPAKYFLFLPATGLRPVPRILEF